MLFFPQNVNDAHKNIEIPMINTKINVLRIMASLLCAITLIGVENAYAKLDPISQYKDNYQKYVKKYYAPREHEKKLAKAKWLVDVLDYKNRFARFIFFNYAEDRHIFILMCKYMGDQLNSSLGDTLRRDFGWRSENFNWANDALNSEPEMLTSVEEALGKPHDVARAEQFIELEHDITHAPRKVFVSIELCEAMKTIHYMMLPDKRKP